MIPSAIISTAASASLLSSSSSAMIPSAIISTAASASLSSSSSSAASSLANLRLKAGANQAAKKVQSDATDKNHFIDLLNTKNKNNFISYVAIVLGDQKLQNILKLQPFSSMNNILSTMNNFVISYTDNGRDPVMKFSMGRRGLSNKTIEVYLPPGNETEICFFDMPESFRSNYIDNDNGNNQVFLFSLTVLCYMEHFNSYAKTYNMFCVPNFIIHNIDVHARGKQKNGVIYKSESTFLLLLGFLRTREERILTNSFIYKMKQK